jgi:hypothetical protein
MKNSRLTGIDLAYALSVIGTMIAGFFFVVGDRDHYLSHEHYFPFIDIFPAWFVFMNGYTSSVTMRDRRISSRKLFSFTSRKGSILFLISLILCLVWNVNVFLVCGLCYMLAPFIFRYSNPILAVIAVVIAASSVALLNLGVPESVSFFTIELSGSGWREFIGFAFFNSYFSFLPWSVFFVLGLIVGRGNLHIRSLIGPTNLLSVMLMGSGFIVHKMFNGYYVVRDVIPIEGNFFLLQHKMYLPGFLLFAFGLSMLLTNVCVYALKGVENKRITDVINTISSMKYSIYTAHLVIGVLTVAIFTPASFKNKYILMLFVGIATFASVRAILFWKKKVNDLGPVEWIMKRLSGSVRT